MAHAFPSADIQGGRTLPCMHSAIFSEYLLFRGIQVLGDWDESDGRSVALSTLGELKVP